jgi:AcrR family transcriptional regulator
MNMSPRIVDKEKKKTEIMMAAMGVFAKKGLKSTKMADIAEAAGIGKGTIYEYFRSRDMIFVEACNLFMVDLMAKMKDLAESELAPPDKLKAMTELMLAIPEQFSPEMTAIMVDFWSEGIRSTIPDQQGLIDIRSLYDEGRRYYQQVLEEGIHQGIFREMNTFLVASALLGMLDGMQLQWVLSPEAFNFKEVPTRLMKLIIHGIEHKTTGD